MGILLMNIVAFAMPSDAYFNPTVYGDPSPADLWGWAAMFILVDSKMRGLFSILFGASMLLVYERAEAAEGDGAPVHVRRMVWLLVFGLLHFYLVWFGDILNTYALCGLFAMSLLLADEAGLKRAAIGLIGLNFALLAIPAGFLTGWRWLVMRPGASGALVQGYERQAESLSTSSSFSEILRQVELYRGPYWPILEDRITRGLWDPLTTLLMNGFETIGLMAIGMLLLRNGFLTGQWDAARYRRTMVRAYAIGIPPLVLLAFWQWASGFDQIVSLGSFLAWSMPPRIAVTVGHAALAMLLIKRFAKSRPMARIEAAGKAAFTNYLGTSIAMTTLFYGYGFGLFGHLSRWQAYFVAPAAWIIMLAWSKPWLDRYRYGPLEWVWRSLARWELQPMRR